MLQPFIVQTFNGIIWRLQTDSQTDIIALEIRNEQDRQTSFAALNLQSGQSYFTSLTLPERWLTGLEAVYNGVILLHYYKNESSPEHKAIIAIDAQTAAELWSDYNLAFDYASINGLAVYHANIQPKKLLLANSQNGNILRPCAQTDTPVNNDITLPHFIPVNEAPHFQMPDEPYGNMIHYLNFNNYIIVSLHTLKSGLLQQHLYILNDDEVIYHDLLNQNIQKLQPEAFVLRKNALIYIKNKAEIKALKL